MLRDHARPVTRRRPLASSAAIAVRVRGALVPQVALVHRRELRGDEPALARQLRPLLAGEAEVPRRAPAARGPRKHTASPPSIPFFVPPNERTSTPASVVNEANGSAQRDRGVGEPSAVHVEQHPVLVREVGERADLLGRVDGAELGDLRDRDHRGLDVVLEAEAGEMRAARARVSACRRVWGRASSLEPVKRSGRSALVGRDVRGGGADDRLPRA